MHSECVLSRNTKINDFRKKEDYIFVHKEIRNTAFELENMQVSCSLVVHEHTTSLLKPPALSVTLEPQQPSQRE